MLSQSFLFLFPLYLVESDFKIWHYFWICTYKIILRFPHSPWSSSMTGKHKGCSLLRNSTQWFQISCYSVSKFQEWGNPVKLLLFGTVCSWDNTVQTSALQNIFFPFLTKPAPCSHPLCPALTLLSQQYNNARGEAGYRLNYYNCA